jgi:hypothetical protein
MKVRRLLPLSEYGTALTTTGHAAVAQPVEHRIRNARVGGSSPFRGTMLYVGKQHYRAA